MAEISRKVRSHNAGLDLESLFETPWHRYDIVLTFLAMLELRKAGEVSLEQASSFAPIRVLGTSSATAKEGDGSQWIARSA